MAAPTTLTAIFHAFDLPFLFPLAIGIGGAIAPGGGAAGAIPLEFTAIGTCLWRYVEHISVASRSQNCGTPSKSYTTDLGAALLAGTALHKIHYDLQITNGKLHEENGCVYTSEKFWHSLLGVEFSRLLVVLDGYTLEWLFDYLRPRFLRVELVCRKATGPQPHNRSGDSRIAGVWNNLRR
jgi:hypothetical protein